MSFYMKFFAKNTTPFFPDFPDFQYCFLPPPCNMYFRHRLAHAQLLIPQNIPPAHTLAVAEHGAVSPGTGGMQVG